MAEFKTNSILDKCVSWSRCLCLILLSFMMDTLSPASALELSTSIDEKLAMGAYLIDLPAPTFYEYYIPIYYEYKVPVYRNIDVTLRDWRGKCTTEGITPSYTCPVFFHFERFLERFEQEVVPKPWVEPFHPDLGKNFTSVASEMNNLESYCKFITKTFQGSFTKSSEFENYLIKLRLCPVAGEAMIIHREIEDYLYSMKLIFKKMNENYELEFSNKFFTEANKKIGPAFYVNAVSSHQNSLLIAFWVEKTRWSQANLACSMQKIPESLTKPQNLSQDLQFLNSKLELIGQSIALPVEEISQFYKFPIADCSYIESSGNFVVQVSIPATQTRTLPLKMYKLQTVPFIFQRSESAESKGTGMDETQLCELEPFPQNFVYDPNEGRFTETSCSNLDPLCLVQWDQGHSTLSTIQTLCIQAIFSNWLVGVKRHCRVRCVPFHIASEKEPFVRKIDHSTWALTGNLNEQDIRIACGQQRTRNGVLGDQVPKVRVSGALEVKLACDCQLMLGNVTIHPSISCDTAIKSPSLGHLNPIFFYKELDLKSIHSPMDILNLRSYAPNTNELDEPLRKEPERLEQTESKRMDKELVEKILKLETESDGQNIGFLWALVILQLIIISGIIFFGTYRYLRYRKLTISTERLVTMRASSCASIDS